MTEIEQVFACVVCGRAWPSKQSLRAHMKVHKGEYMRTSIQVKTEPWEEFLQLCKDHKTTSCHVLNTLVEGILKGAKTGNIDLPKILSPNPVIINLSQVFLGKPRSAWKTDITRGLMMGPACPRCGSREISMIHPEDLEYSSGRCLRCRAEFLVTRRDV